MGLKLLSHVNADSDLVEAWLKYYLQLGVARFHLVVHGGREENSRLFAIKDSYPITIEATYEGPFLGEHKKNHLDAVLARHTEQWLVLVDSDEFVEFPYRNIPKTIQKLNFERATVMAAPMLQRIQADGGLETPPLIDDPFEVMPLCSEDLYQRLGVEACILKYPLFFCESDTQLTEEGNHNPPRGSERRISAMRGVTHHFKFRRTVSQRLDSRINSAYLWRHESVQFREYLDSHFNRLPVEGSFHYSRKELFRRGLLRKLTLRNNIGSIARKFGVWD
ncbi:MAG: glycosyltransferase family 2 protein [Candidatus Acidiferrum sp.]